MDTYYLKRLRKKYNYFWGNDGSIIAIRKNNSNIHAFSPSDGNPVLQFLAYFLGWPFPYLKQKRLITKANRCYQDLLKNGNVALPQRTKK